jgi:hypothetical protein
MHPRAQMPVLLVYWTRTKWDLPACRCSPRWGQTHGRSPQSSKPRGVSFRRRQSSPCRISMGIQSLWGEATIEGGLSENGELTSLRDLV